MPVFVFYQTYLLNDNLVCAAIGKIIENIC